MTKRTAVLLAAICLSALSAALPPRPAPARADEPEAQRNIATFSVVAYDPATGEVGVAVQSKFFAVGSVVPYAQAGVGALASQAFGNTTFGPRGLELMEEGYPAAQALLELISADDDAARRQVGIVGVGGGNMLEGWLELIDPALPVENQPTMSYSEDPPAAAFSYTGGECMDWAGGFASVTPDGVVYCCQGNILTGADVVDAMANAMDYGIVPDGTVLTSTERTAVGFGDLAGRMLAALLAGQSKGGDSRGMQSAALLVKQEGAGYGGYNDVKYDLRVDDALDPFNELARLLNLARPFALTNHGYRVLYEGEYAEAIEIFSYLAELEPKVAFHPYNLACALSLSGELEAALEQLALALELDPMMQGHAAQDPDLEPLHGMAGFAELVGTEESGAADAVGE